MNRLTNWAARHRAGSLHIFNSALSENVVRDVLYASIAGALILFPSLALLLYVFKDQRKQPLFGSVRPAAALAESSSSE